MNIDELNKVLELHKLWLENKEGGVRANLGDAYLGGAYLGDANLRGANLRDAYLGGANLRDAYLRDANLRDANLRDANLRDANLRDANLGGANLRDANLRDANLRDANLRDANLRGANLGGANLRDANLGGANLQMARGVKFAQCGFEQHGECGRMLSLVEIDGKLVFFCGCFKGSPDELQDYIDKGSDKLKKTRQKAKDFCMSCFEIS